jgi:hypothetical protein
MWVKAFMAVPGQKVGISPSSIDLDQAQIKNIAIIL